MQCNYKLTASIVYAFPSLKTMTNRKNKEEDLDRRTVQKVDGRAYQDPL